MTEIDHETWLLDAGDAIVEKKAADGAAALSPLERLTYCLWVADYGMRNAGDLETAGDLYLPFLEEGRAAAQSLGLPHATAAFSLSKVELEQRYFTLFDQLVVELRAA